MLVRVRRLFATFQHSFRTIVGVEAKLEYASSIRLPELATGELVEASLCFCLRFGPWVRPNGARFGINLGTIWSVACAGGQPEWRFRFRLESGTAIRICSNTRAKWKQRGGTKGRSAMGRKEDISMPMLMPHAIRFGTSSGKS